MLNLVLNLVPRYTQLYSCCRYRFLCTAVQLYSAAVRVVLQLYIYLKNQVRALVLSLLRTEPLCKRISFISRSCPILVLTTVLGQNVESKCKNVKNRVETIRRQPGVLLIAAPTTSQENAVRTYLGT